MPYDPVRDRHDPSPIDATGSSRAWQDGSRPTSSDTAPLSSHLPSFRSNEQSLNGGRPPSSAGLRSLLNDEPPPRTRDSRTSISSLTAEDPPSGASSTLISLPQEAVYADRTSTPARASISTPYDTEVYPSFPRPSSRSSSTSFAFQPPLSPSPEVVGRRLSDAAAQHQLPSPATSSAAVPAFGGEVYPRGTSSSSRAHPSSASGPPIQSRRPSTSLSAAPASPFEHHSTAIDELNASSGHEELSTEEFSYTSRQGVEMTVWTTMAEFRAIHAWMGHWNNPLKWRNRPPPQLPSVAQGLRDLYANNLTSPETRRTWLLQHWPDHAELASAALSSEPKRQAGRNGQGSAVGPETKRQRQSTNGNAPQGVGSREDHNDYTGNAGHVADHYNSRPEVGLQNRELSPIIGLKKFNNWIKSVLIGKFAHRVRGQPGAHVLDIGCGKGGDLNKWKQARIRLYVGLDIARTSIEQAAERYSKMNRPGFDAFFYDHDCYSKSIKDVLPEDLAQRDLYDNVTMQFCMHYAFESASKARMMMENVSRYLRPGGVFIGTIPDSQLLLNRLEEIPEDEPELRFGNSCYFVEFTEREHQGLYGHQYRFFLEDAVGDVPEYIVDWDNFEALAAEYGLRLIYKKSFSAVLEEEQESRDFGPLLGRMGVVNAAGESAMDDDQWEAANLYMAFAFQKQ